MARRWEGSTFGERVRHLAGMRGLSLNHLAALAGLPSGTISRHARQDAVVPDHVRPLHALCEAGRVSFAWLAFGEGQPDDLSARRIRERPEWDAARIAALAAHGELADADVEAVGDMPDAPGVLPALDGPFVAGMAAEVAALRRRRAKDRPANDTVIPIRRPTP